MTETDHTVDLAAYFARIGYTSSTEPTLATLAGIVRQHAHSIPFENLTPLMGRTPALDLPSLQQKLISARRGGYCFEQNRLLQSVLAALGYATTDLLARVVWNTPADTLLPRSHMLLRVEVAEQSYIVDVGFGSMTLTSPLRLERDTVQPTTLEPFRLVAGTRSDLVTEVLVGGSWRPVYEFDLRRQYPIDFAVPNWYVSTNPSSHFLTALVAARPAEGRRYGLRNRQLTVRHLDGTTEQRVLTQRAELRQALAEDLLISLPDDPALDQALDRILALPLT